MSRTSEIGVWGRFARVLAGTALTWFAVVTWGLRWWDVLGTVVVLPIIAALVMLTLVHTLGGPARAGSNASAPSWMVFSVTSILAVAGLGTVLQRVLGFGSDETAWAWLHKLRRAMVRPDRERLCGIVEVDESFIGGQTPGRKGGSTLKAPVMIVWGAKKAVARALGVITFRVCAAAVPDLGPTERLAGPIGPVLRVEGCRVAGAASRGRCVETNDPEASAELG